MALETAANIWSCFSAALKSIGPIRVLRTRTFESEVRALRVGRVIPEDARALVDVSRAIGADALVFVQVSPGQSKRRLECARWSLCGR